MEWLKDARTLLFRSKVTFPRQLLSSAQKTDKPWAGVDRAVDVELASPRPIPVNGSF